MVKFIMLIGLPGSGKSTWTQYEQYTTVSSDELRNELYGDVNDQNNPSLIFDEARKRIIHSLNCGKDTVLDTDNI